MMMYILMFIDIFSRFSMLESLSNFALGCLYLYTLYLSNFTALPGKLLVLKI